ncbi:MAG TPA: glycosyltransferase family 39 protein [Ktedonobacteraceae bacterium]
MQGSTLSNNSSTLDTPDDISLLPTQPTLPATPVAPAIPTSGQVPLSEAQKKVTVAQIWQEAILPYLGTRLLILVVGLFATYYIMPLLVHVSPLPSPATMMAFPQSLWLMWSRFDGGFYIQIAQSNYWAASTLHERTDWVFYPLFPLLISGGAKLLGGSSAAYYIAGILIANIAGVFMMVYLYLLVRREFNSKIASRSVLYLALFPTGFFFSAVFTESLLLGLTIACIYYARRQSWWLAGLCGGLAALTRLQGITLIVPVAWEYLRVVSARYAQPPENLPKDWSARAQIEVTTYFRGLFLAMRELKNWLNALALILIPCGLLIFMIYAKLYINDFFATFHASSWGWHRMISPPWRLIIYSLRNPILGQPLNWNFWVLNIVTALAGLAVIIWAWRRLPMIYTIYTALVVLLPLASSMLNSYGRYALLFFPAFILLATFTSKHKDSSKNEGKEEHLHTFIVASFATLEAVFMIFFVLGLPTIA